jgi:hypothetical protein
MPKRKAEPVAPEIPPTPSRVLQGELNINQELFCRYYTQNSDLFGNATRSYAEAYNHLLHTLPDDDHHIDPETKKRVPSTRQRAENVCAVEGARLLRNPKVLARITTLLNELLTEEVVDAELLRVILQNDELAAKVRAIQEFNKLRQRITNKVDLTSGGMTIADLIRQADDDYEEEEETEG